MVFPLRQSAARVPRTLEGFFFLDCVLHFFAQRFFPWLTCHSSDWQNTWRAGLHTRQANTRSWPQLAYSCQLEPFLVQHLWAALQNRTDTHVTDTCVINLTNISFSRAWLTLRCGEWVKSKVTQNHSCSLWNKACLGLFSRAASASSQCSGCCLHSSLWSAVIMVQGCGEDFLLDVRGFASSRGSSGAACFATFTQRGRKQPSLLISTTSIDCQFCFYAHHAPFPNPVVNANSSHPHNLVFVLHFSLLETSKCVKDNSRP